MAKNLVIVADQAIARVYSLATPRSRLKELATIDHSAGRLRNQGFEADRPGRSFQTSGKKRHALQRKIDPRTQHAMMFARSLAAQVEKMRLRGEVERLILVAPPKFLGLLRDALGTESRRLLQGQFLLNLTGMKAADIRARLPDKIFQLVQPRQEK
jgi:protein required for attachment to host cells